MTTVYWGRHTTEPHPLRLTGDEIFVPEGETYGDCVHRWSGSGVFARIFADQKSDRSPPRNSPVARSDS